MPAIKKKKNGIFWFCKKKNGNQFKNGKVASLVSMEPAVAPGQPSLT